MSRTSAAGDVKRLPESPLSALHPYIEENPIKGFSSSYYRRSSIEQRIPQPPGVSPAHVIDPALNAGVELHTLQNPELPLKPKVF